MITAVSSLLIISGDFLSFVLHHDILPLTHSEFQHIAMQQLSVPARLYLLVVEEGPVR